MNSGVRNAHKQVGLVDIPQLSKNKIRNQMESNSSSTSQFVGDSLILLQ